MALTDYKITNGERSKNQIRSGGAPDRLTGSSDENKRVFDRFALLLADKYNDVIDELVNLFSTHSGRLETIRAELQDEIESITESPNPLMPKGLYATLSDLEAAHPTGVTGDSWLVGTTEVKDVYIWDEDQDAWVNVGGLIDSAGFKTAFNKNFENLSANLQMNGTADVGALDTIPRADHVHPSDTGKANLVSGFVSDAELLDEDTINTWRDILGIS